MLRSDFSFMSVYIYGDPNLSSKYRGSISEAGELTLWEHLEKPYYNIEEMLSTEVRIVNKRIGCYIDRKYFVSHSDDYRKIVKDFTIFTK